MIGRNSNPLYFFYGQNGFKSQIDPALEWGDLQSRTIGEDDFLVVLPPLFPQNNFLEVEKNMNDKETDRVWNAITELQQEVTALQTKMNEMIRSI